MDIKSFFEGELQTQLSQREDILTDEKGIYQIKIDNQAWYVNLNERPLQIITGEASAPDCCLEISEADFSKLIQGQLNIPMALLTRRLKFRGELSRIHRLKELLS
jgi:putative sterol carrier protein